MEQTTFRAGPMPDAEELRRYGEVLPELPKMIADGVVEVRRHRHSMDRHANIRAYIGQAVATVFAGYIIWRSFEAIQAGHEIGGAAGILGTLGALVGIFVIQYRKQG